MKNIKYVSLFLFLIFASCQKKYEDYTLTYYQLPDEVRFEFDKIFNTVASNETFIIVSSTNKSVKCNYEMKSKLNFTAKIDLYCENFKVTIPFELTAVRIFIYSSNHIYYINKNSFSKLEGGKLNEFLDYKNQKYSVFKTNG